MAVPQVVVAGLLTRLSFPDPGWWPLAVVGAALWLVALAGRNRRAGAGLGLLYGLAMFVPMLQWSGTYVGAGPWLALATLEALYLALLGLVLPAVLPRAGWSLQRCLAGTAVVAGLWTAQEALRGRTPFGGFPWGRLAFAVTDSPYLGLAALGGAPLVTFAVAWTSAALAWAALRLLERRGRALPVVVAAGLAVVIALAGLIVPLPTSGRPVQVAGVQGNVPEAGLDFNAERRAVLDNHARGTTELARRVAAGTATRPDVVLWPENASDLDPYQQPDARAVIDDAVDTIGVPVLVGAVLQQPVGRLTNASIVWTPGQGPGAMYAKRHPVPFGEYIPYRGFFRKLSSKVDLVQRDFVAGKRPGVLDLGAVRAGIAICFEVAYDGLVRDTVKGGADLLVVQTNNATFGYSDEAVQQLAMSRFRAVEHGRSVVQISTVGVSAMFLPNGRQLARSELFTPAVLQAALPARTSLTVADRLGGWVELALVTLGLLGAAALILVQRRAGQRRFNAAPVARGTDEASPAAQRESQPVGQVGPGDAR